MKKKCPKCGKLAEKKSPMIKNGLCMSMMLTRFVSLRESGFIKSDLHGER
jgi:hypothetical protein